LEWAVVTRQRKKVIGAWWGEREASPLYLRMAMSLRASTNVQVNSSRSASARRVQHRCGRYQGYQLYFANIRDRSTAV
jgi:hypothetical protein